MYSSNLEKVQYGSILDAKFKSFAINGTNLKISRYVAVTIYYYKFSGNLPIISIVFFAQNGL